MTADERNAGERDFWTGRAGQTWVAQEQALERMHAPFIPPILEGAALSQGDHVLDIGCGTGALTRAAAAQIGPGGRATGLDISATMLAGSAAMSGPDTASTQWLEADAQVYGFEPGTFDAIVSRMGVMFFDDPVAAFANLLRATKPGARFSAICWRSGMDAPWFAVGRAAIEDVLGPQPVPDPHAPGPMAFADAGRVLRLMAKAGWVKGACQKTPLVLRPGGGLAGAVALAERVGPAARIMNDPALTAKQPALRASLSDRLARFLTADGMAIPVVMNHFTAQAPRAV